MRSGGACMAGRCAWWWVCMAGGVWQEGMNGRGVCMGGGMCGRRNDLCSGRYTSYSNVFLFYKCRHDMFLDPSRTTNIKDSSGSSVVDSIYIN